MNRTNLDILAERVLLKIRDAGSKLFSSTALARQCEIDEIRLTDALIRIGEWGYRLRKNRRGEITFVSAPDSMTDTEIRFRLRTKVIAQRIFCYQSVKSTNDKASQLAESGVPDGTIVTAEEQTKGRGRLGREWHSPPGAGIYVSIILKPGFEPKYAPGVSIMTALALAETMNKYCPGEVRIKWPNDILISGRKAAGILTELSAEGHSVNHIVVGVGININHRAEEFPEHLKDIATSIRRASKHKIDRLEFFRAFLVNFEKEYLKYRKSHLTRSRSRILAYSSLIGSEVELAVGRRIIKGLATDIDASGALILDIDGKKTPITSGEVSVVKGRR